MSARKPLHCIAEDALVVCSADIFRPHVAAESNSIQPRGVVRLSFPGVRSTRVVEIRPQPADEGFGRRLERRGCEDGVEEAEEPVVQVPEVADPELHQRDDEGREDDGDHGNEPVAHHAPSIGVREVGGYDGGRGG